MRLSRFRLLAATAVPVTVAATVGMVAVTAHAAAAAAGSPTRSAPNGPEASAPP